MSAASRHCSSQLLRGSAGEFWHIGTAGIVFVWLVKGLPDVPHCSKRSVDTPLSRSPACIGAAQLAPVAGPAASTAVGRSGLMAARAAAAGVSSSSADNVDGDHEAAQSNTAQVRMNATIRNVLVTLVQNDASDVAAGLPSMRAVHGKTNLGHVVEASLRANGFEWSTDGSRVWRRADAADKIKLQPTKAANSSRAAAEKTSALKELERMSLNHDADVAGNGSRAAQAAAEAARPQAARALVLVRPAAADKLKTGSGYGNVPRRLGACCAAEQSAIDGLVLLTEEHAKQCGAPLRRVDPGAAGGIFWSAHSMGFVNVCRYTCENGCSFNWASAKPLPGPPAKPSRPEPGPSPAPAAQPTPSRTRLDSAAVRKPT